MSQIINHLYSKHIFDEVLCRVILAILMLGKVFLVLLYFLPIFPQNTFSFFLLFISPCTLFLVSFYISQFMLRSLDLKFLNILSLKLNVSAISLANDLLLVFFILTVFKGAILCTTSISLHTLFFFIVRKYHLAQSLSILIN